MNETAGQPATPREIWAWCMYDFANSAFSFTDDLEMNAIVDHYGVGEAAVLAFRAGADILLLCKDRDRVVTAMETVYEAVKKGEISEARLPLRPRMCSTPLWTRAGRPRSHRIS